MAFTFFLAGNMAFGVLSSLTSGEGNGNHCSILAQKLPWTEEPGGYSPWGRKEWDTTEQLDTHSFLTRGWTWTLGSESEES